MIKNLNDEVPSTQCNAFELVDLFKIIYHTSKVMGRYLVLAE